MKKRAKKIKGGLLLYSLLGAVYLRYRYIQSQKEADNQTIENVSTIEGYTEYGENYRKVKGLYVPGAEPSVFVTVLEAAFIPFVALVGAAGVFLGVKEITELFGKPRNNNTTVSNPINTPIVPYVPAPEPKNTTANNAAFFVIGAAVLLLLNKDRD